MKIRNVAVATAIAGLGATSAHAAITTIASSTEYFVSGDWSDGMGGEDTTAMPNSFSSTDESVPLVIVETTSPAPIPLPVGYSGTVSGSLSNQLASPSKTLTAGGAVLASANSACGGASCFDPFSYAQVSATAAWTTSFTLDPGETASLSYAFTALSSNALPTFSAYFFMADADGVETGDALFGDTFDTTSSGYLFFNTLLAAGNYILKVNLGGFANVDSGALAALDLTGSATLTFGSPVPLPGAAWLLMSGIGALGATVRRRRQVAADA